MRSIIAALFFTSACVATPLPDVVRITDGPQGWVGYSIDAESFLIQTRFNAIEINPQDADGQCASNGARLPTSREWQIVAASDFAGMQRPFYREWFHDVGGAGFYWIGDNAMHADTASIDPVAFRCAR